VPLSGHIVFDGNRANTGAAIYVHGTLLFEQSITFSHNSASGNGGAIFAVGQVTFQHYFTQ
jgi:predicted outer membrane repeat protein